MLLTQDELKRQLHYDLETGIFTRRISNSGSIKVGEVAGTDFNGYRKTNVNNKQYLDHRLAFLYMTGEWPKNQMDHINQVRDDNRWLNLRECTNSQNNMNKPIQSNNKTGYRGVNIHQNSYRARVKFNNKEIHIGCFNCIHEAAKAYNKKALELFGEFACLNKIKGEV